MADNETTGTGKAVATDKVTYSGDADQNVQLIRPVHVAGSEGARTVVERRTTQNIASVSAGTAVEIVDTPYIAVKISGNFTGLTYALQATWDGTNWIGMGSGILPYWESTNEGSFSISTGTSRSPSNGDRIIVLFPTSGARAVRINVTALSTNSVDVVWTATEGPPTVQPVLVGSTSGIATTADVGNGTSDDQSGKNALAVFGQTYVYDGSTWDRWRGNSTGGGFVQGPAAHASPTAGNPVLVAGKASNAIPTDVGADDDAASLWTNRNGALVVGYAPHVALNGSPWSLTSKTVQTTTTQTGSDVVTPTSGKKLVVTSVQIQAGGTVAGTVQLWFGANADTTYTRGTDLAIFDGEFAPSSTLKPGIVMQGPFIASAADHEIHLTTSAAINPLTITVWYYEI
jgi:hypothetical protein